MDDQRGPELERACRDLAAYAALLERLGRQLQEPDLEQPCCYWDVDDSLGLQYFKLTLYSCTCLGLPAALINWSLGELSLSGLLLSLLEGPLLGAVVGLLLGLVVLGISGTWQGQEVERLNRQVRERNRQIHRENQLLLSRCQAQRRLLEAELRRAQGLLLRLQESLGGEIEDKAPSAESQALLSRLEREALGQLEQLQALDRGPELQRYYAQLEALDEARKTQS